MIFVTPVFKHTNTGPATFACYLHSYFNHSEDIDFHIVAPCLGPGPGFHSVAPREGRFVSRIYSDLQHRALEVASGLPANTVVHVNNTFTLGRLAQHTGTIILQVNDYNSARLFQTISRKFAARDYRGAAMTTPRHLGERRAIRRATVAVCNSEATAAVIRSVYHPPLEKMRVISKAVDLNRFRRPTNMATEPAWPIPAPASRLVFVGSDFHCKGLDVLLEALARLQEAHPAQLVVIGGAAPAIRKRFERLTDRLGLAAHVAFVGPIRQDDLAPWLWTADLAILPSRSEALGVAAIEAMAAGLPVVASKVGGLPEIVSAENGALVPPDNPEALSKAIAALLLDPEARRQCGIAALRTAHRFRVDDMCARYDALYRELSSGPSTDP